MNMTSFFSLVAVIGIGATSYAAESFKPVLGDEATYEVTTPIGSNVTRRVLESFDANTQKFTIATYAEANGKMQKQLDHVATEKVEALYIDDINTFCAAKSGTMVQVPFETETWTACQIVKDNGVLRQEDFWVAGIPFGHHNFFRKSPLHPKAGTTTRLMSFKLADR